MSVPTDEDKPELLGKKTKRTEKPNKNKRAGEI